MSLDWSLVSSDVFASLNIEELLSASTEREALAYSVALAPLCSADGRRAAAELTCLRLLHGMLQMVLRHADAQEPFGPLIVLGDRPGSWSTEEIPKSVPLGLQAWAENIADAELRARVLDVIWTRGRVFKAAHGAVRAYVQAAKLYTAPEDWYHAEARLERALRLAASLHRGGLELKGEVLAAIQAEVGRTTDDGTPLRRRLIGLLLEFDHGDPAALGKMASAMGVVAFSKAEYFHASDAHSLAADCFAKAADLEARALEQRAAAEALASEAEAAFKRPSQGAIAAASLMGDAVTAMRQAGGGGQRAAELHARMLEWQKLSVGQMKEFSTRTDVSHLARQAIDAVRGKPTFRDAVIALCQLTVPPSINTLKRQAHDEAKEQLFGTIAPTEIVNYRGRVVAIVPPLSPSVEELADDGLRARMYQCATRWRDLMVTAKLNPALQEICAEHHPSRHDIAELIRYSSSIPEGHRESFVRALAGGFEGDMHLVAHFVPPQFEAMVRHVLESVGADTSVLAANGLQPERLFKPLLELNEASRVFGEDAVFEMTDLFVDHLGDNLRNEALHGLLSDEDMNSTPVFYAWWLLLKYCVLSPQVVDKRSSGIQPSVHATPSTLDSGHAPDDTSTRGKGGHD